MQENVEELSEELSRIRRRSALLEKTGVQNAFDSFCDISDDAKLLDIVEAFESNEEISKWFEVEQSCFIIQIQTGTETTWSVLNFFIIR